MIEPNGPTETDKTEAPDERRGAPIKTISGATDSTSSYMGDSRHMTHHDFDTIRDAGNDERPDDDRFQAVNATITKEDWYDAVAVTATAEDISSEQFLARVQADERAKTDVRLVLVLILVIDSSMRSILADAVPVCKGKTTAVGEGYGPVQALRERRVPQVRYENHPCT